MLNDDFRRFMERHNLVDMAKGSVKLSERIFKECIAPKKEKILIIGDVGASNRRISPTLATSFYVAANNLKLNVDLFLQTPAIHGQKAHEAVVGAMDRLEENSIILLFMSSRLGEMGKLGNSFRTFAKSRNHRFMTAHGLGCMETGKYAELVKAMDVDYAEMQKRGQKLKEILDNAKEVHVTTKAGTDFTMSIEGVSAIANTADYRLPGTGGNMPCGEVYIAPKGTENVFGKVVVDVSMSYREGTMLLKRPVTLHLDKGEIVKIEGSLEGLYLRDTITWAQSKTKNPGNVAKICELGIGINRNAKSVGATIMDEKTYGTAHIALGSNYWFGGPIYANTHFDQVFKNPKIEVDGKVLRI